MKKIIQHIIFIVLWLLLLNFSLFFGLQVSTTLGNIGMITTVVVLVAYIVYNIKN